jgi:hypothetical protein
MLPDDTKAPTDASAGIIVDPRVRHFHDPQQRSGKAIAGGLGWEEQTAWDIYLFYDKASRWTERPPAPLDFMHQLPWDPSRFRTGDALVLGLRETVQKLLEKEIG